MPMDSVYHGETDESRCRFRKCRAVLPPGAIYCPVCGRKQTADERIRSKRPNGSGSVYKNGDRRSKPWVVVKQGVYIGSYPTKQAAVEALDKLQDVQLDDRYNLTFADAYAEAMRLKAPDLSKSGLENYHTGYNYCESIAERRIRELRAVDYQKVIDSVSEAGRGVSVAQKVRGVISATCQWAQTNEIIARNYAELVKLPREEKKEKEIFTPEEIRMIEAEGSDGAKVVLALIYTGMRINELLQMPKEDYHGTYCIGGEKTEAGKNRVIPVPDIARPIFTEFAASASVRLVDGIPGTSSKDNFRNRVFNPLMGKLGITGKTLHCTRHTFASVASSYMKPEELQKVIGHADYSTTANIYVHRDIDQLVAAANAVRWNQ